MDVARTLLEKVLLGSEEESASSFRQICDLARSKGIYPASIHDFYIARGTGEIPATFTVPAINLRGFTYGSARAILRAAKELSAFVVFELARSEMGYTGQPGLVYAGEILAAAVDEAWEGPIFLQADHTQFKAASPGVAAEGEMEALQHLIDADMAAGFLNIDIDGSTLVDLSKPTVPEQQKANVAVTSELLAYIRARQTSGVQISVGGEIGHIGDTNSTPEDMTVFLDGMASVKRKDFIGLSKVSVQTGTRHGGVVDASGKNGEMTVDFGVLDALGAIAREHGVGGVVQHGASTLLDSQLSQFPAHKTLEIHLATGWQNLVMDHPSFPADLTTKINTWIDTQFARDKMADESVAQFHYRMRKKAWGQFQKDVWGLPTSVAQTLADAVYERAKVILSELGMTGTRQYLAKYAPMPRAQGMKAVQTLGVQGKRVIVRVDYNITFGRALEIVDGTRIVRTLPTLQWLLAHGAKQIVLLSHLGKPGGKVDPTLSLVPVAAYASKLLGKEIIVTNQLTNIPTNQLVMLENLRFWSGEESNDPEFAKQLASLGDVYVDEAFGESHRSTASIVGVPKLLPSAAGLWFTEEVERITRAVTHPDRPFVVIMGGAKVDDKIQLLDVLSHKADVILLGGKLANEYMERNMRLSGSARVVTPVDGLEQPYLDIGVETQQLYSTEIAQAGTIVWNGPMGKIEDPQYVAGTDAIFAAVADNDPAYTVVGGGDTLAALHDESHLERIDHVSTGGGAMLTLIEKGTLPGIEVLKRAEN